MGYNIEKSVFKNAGFKWVDYFLLKRSDKYR